MNQKLNINIVVGVVMSDNAKDVWKFELNDESYLNYDFTFFDKKNAFLKFVLGQRKKSFEEQKCLI